MKLIFLKKMKELFLLERKSIFHLKDLSSKSMVVFSSSVYLLLFKYSFVVIFMIISLLWLIWIKIWLLNYILLFVRIFPGFLNHSFFMNSRTSKSSQLFSQRSKSPNKGKQGKDHDDTSLFLQCPICGLNVSIIRIIIKNRLLNHW